MTYRHFKYEGWLYALAFILALMLRLLQLGAMPLTDLEAIPALQALQIAQSLKPALSPHPFYILSTSIFFFLYGGGTNFLARLAPALVGSTLVFAPFLFANRIKPRPSLFLAFFIALDPGLISISRQAASPIFAITFLFFAWGFFYSNKLNFASIFAALALLSGPSIWIGLLGIGITWAIVQVFNSRPNHSSTVDTSSLPMEPVKAANQTASTVPAWLIPFVSTFIIAGTLFFIVPNGLSAALASIPAFINRWTTLSDFSISRLFFSLIVYQPLGVLLALIAIVRGWWAGSRRIILLSIWFLVTLLLVIIIPSGQINDLAWALIPLWTIAALELTRSVTIFSEERNEVISVIFLTAFIWIFAWLDFSGMVWLPTDSGEYALRFWLLMGSLFLIVVSLLLVAAGWSLRIARIGGVWGLTLTLGILGLGGAFGAAGLRGLNHPELWWQPSIPIQADLVQSTVDDLSQWGLGNNNAAPVIIAGLDSPALEWVLRERKVLVVKTLDVSSSPYFVITPLQDNPGLASAYRGQDFTWRQTPLWNTSLVPDWMRWIAVRDMPQSGESIILWARDDLFLHSAPASGNP